MPDTLDRCRQVLHQEAQAIAALASDLGRQSQTLTAVCTLIRERCSGNPGRLVLTGVGKAGLIARKIAASAASTGTPAFFLHPTEAFHGDLGMVQEHDVVLALSNSGSSQEILDLLPPLKRIGSALVALVGKTDSPLARHADYVLSIGTVLEACPLGLAPSTSTTTLLALGDALILAVQGQRGFTSADYARFHPGGALGRKLMTCSEAMRQGERVPRIDQHTTMLSALQAITRARAGSALIVDHHQHLLGIFTDGDLRRALTSGNACGDLLSQPAARFGTCPCKSVQHDELLARALHLCARYHINELPVVDAHGVVAGLIDLQDLASRGFDVRPTTETDAP